MGRSDGRFRCSSEHQGHASLFSLGDAGDSGFSGDGRGSLGQKAESEDTRG